MAELLQGITGDLTTLLDSRAGNNGDAAKPWKTNNSGSTPPSNGVIASPASGQIKLTQGSSGELDVYQRIAGLVVGQQYRFTFVMVDDSNSLSIINMMAITPTAPGEADGCYAAATNLQAESGRVVTIINWKKDPGSGTYRGEGKVIFTATATTMYLRLQNRNNQNTYFTVGSMSLKPDSDYNQGGLLDCAS